MNFKLILLTLCISKSTVTMPMFERAEFLKKPTFLRITPDPSTDITTGRLIESISGHIRGTHCDKHQTIISGVALDMEDRILQHGDKFILEWDRTSGLRPPIYTPRTEAARPVVAYAVTILHASGIDAGCEILYYGVEPNGNIVKYEKKAPKQSWCAIQ